MCTHMADSWTLADSWTPRTVRQLQGTAPIQIAFGYQHGLALSFAQEVYSWGCATWGALGRVYNFTQFGVDETYMPTPQLVFDLQGYRVREVYAGGWHSAVRLENGNVMTWGFNKYGQLGHGTYETEWTPRVVHELVSRAPQKRILASVRAGRKRLPNDQRMLMKTGGLIGTVRARSCG